jgi:predicted adenine nucleotide alpha hydrolase (AANH) superfamily ATPase
MEKKRLLLHTCCAPCVAYTAVLLTKDFNVTAYFFNPNIHPDKEYRLRRDELIDFSKNTSLNLIVQETDSSSWHEYIRGFENEPEKGKRCYKCFEMRLENTAKFAKENNFDIFTTSLSISPHKNAAKINEIGNQLSAKYEIKFFEANFKKNDGFKKSCEIASQYNLYRQTYCGCIYSIRKQFYCNSS